METYDIIMLVVLVGATLFGAIKGFAWQLASIGSLVLSYIVAYRFREPFSEVIKADPPWNRFLAMLILYVGTSFIIWMLFRMISKTIDNLKLKEFDRQVGAVCGLAKGALFCTLITMFAVTLVGPKLREQIVGSRSGFYIAKLLDKSDMVIPPELHDVVAPYIERFENEMQSPSASPGLIPDDVLNAGRRLIPEGLNSDSLNPENLNPGGLAPDAWSPPNWQPPQSASGPSGLPPRR